MAIRFVQDYGNSIPSWSYFYNDTLGNRLQIGGFAVDKIYDFLVQSVEYPYVQLYLYPAGLDVKPYNGSDLTYKLYFSDTYSFLDLGRGYSHFARIRSNGNESDIFVQNAAGTFVGNLYSTFSNAGIDIFTENYGIFGEATANEAYIGVQKGNGEAVIYLDTANIPATAGNKDIVIREIEVCHEGLIKKMLILASEPYV